MRYERSWAIALLIYCGVATLGGRPTVVANAPDVAEGKSPIQATKLWECKTQQDACLKLCFVQKGLWPLGYSLEMIARTSNFCGYIGNLGVIQRQRLSIFRRFVNFEPLSPAPIVILSCANWWKSTNVFCITPFCPHFVPNCAHHAMHFLVLGDLSVNICVFIERRELGPVSLSAVKKGYESKSELSKVSKKSELSKVSTKSEPSKVSGSKHMRSISSPEFKGASTSTSSASVSVSSKDTELESSFSTRPRSQSASSARLGYDLISPVFFVFFLEFWLSCVHTFALFRTYHTWHFAWKMFTSNMMPEKVLYSVCYAPSHWRRNPLSVRVFTESHELPLCFGAVLLRYARHPFFAFTTLVLPSRSDCTSIQNAVCCPYTLLYIRRRNRGGRSSNDKRWRNEWWGRRGAHQNNFSIQ